jgi:hypothetical protein
MTIPARILQILAALWTITSAPASAQAPQPKTTPVTVPEARAMMGYPERNFKHVLGGLAGSKVAILDMGFDGLEDWLKANPKEAGLTRIIKTLPGKTGTHGFDVYRVARQVLGDAEIFIYDLRAYDSNRPELIADMKARDVQIVNASFGQVIFPINRDIPEANNIIGQLINATMKEELFIFFSAGNYGAKVHNFKAKAAGFSYRIPELMVAREGSNGTPDMPPIHTRGGKLAVEFYWDRGIAKESPFAIQVNRKNGTSLVLLEGQGQEQTLTTFDERSRKTEKRTPLVFDRLRLELSDLVDKEIQVFIRKRIGGSQDMPMRLYVGQGVIPRPLNGRESINLYPTFESPFTISVGAMARGNDGKAATTSFSGWGTTRDGKIVPHILGPG